MKAGVGVDLGSELVKLPLKGILTGLSFTVSKRQSHQYQSGLMMPKHQKYRSKKIMINTAGHFKATE